MSEERLATLEEIFSAVFDLPPNVNPRTFVQGASETWDSLGHVSLVAALESEFDVEILPEDSIEITSFETAAEVLEDLMDG